MKFVAFDLPIWIKFAISIVYDIVDFFIPLGFTQLYNLVGIPLGYALWGPIGLANAWELVIPMDVLGKLIPTMTVTGILSLGGK